MILESLKLKNFGLYRGEHTLDLRPGRRNGAPRPIVLIGGINGGGKTTIFDAVQLALYGARGKYSKRTHIPYDEFLRESIHRGIPVAEGASVSLTFRITAAAEQHVYEVRRLWTQRGQALRERLIVLKNGEADQSLAEHWTDVVEEVIPLGVSQLFFFDAEKVRFLADDVRGNETLGNAIKSLLGLDLAERLIADTAVLETRLSQGMKKCEADAELETLVAQIDAKQEEIRSKKEERASLENHRLRAQNEAQRRTDEFERAGGQHWRNRSSRERRLEQLSLREEELTDHLLRLASGPAPLAMIPDLLVSMSEHDRVESDFRSALLIYQLLAKRDAQTIRQLRKKRLSQRSLDAVSNLLKSDREARRPNNKPEVQFELSESSRHLLSHLRQELMAEMTGEVRDILTTMDGVIRERESLQRSLKQTPSNSDVADLIERLNEAGKEFAVYEDRANRLDDELKVLSMQYQELDGEARQRRRKTIEQELHSEEAARMAQLAIRTQATMRDYLDRATTSKIDRLSGLITDSFRFLLRKKTLVETVQIDPRSFVITLFDKEGNALPKQRLSEGEKQIFAISVLWGLAQASPRPLPAIIDTPMARLDSEHRDHLIQRYFPHASHQVIILSTDTEVTQEFYNELEPHLARAYHLNYDEATKVTTPVEGYFWRIESDALVGAHP